MQPPGEIFVNTAKDLPVYWTWAGRKEVLKEPLGAAGFICRDEAKERWLGKENQVSFWNSYGLDA